MPFRVTEIQSTPNPNAAKFLLDRPISEGTISFLSRDEGKGHPIAEALFAISGVCAVLLLGDFVTVNKTDDADWPAVKRKVKQVLAGLGD